MEYFVVDEMEFVRFQNMDDYLAWLEAQSSHEKDKARKFREKFGEDIVPVIMGLCEDTAQQSLGCSCFVHVFIHPDQFDVVWRSIVAETRGV